MILRRSRAWLGKSLPCGGCGGICLDMNEFSFSWVFLYSCIVRSGQPPGLPLHFLFAYRQFSCFATLSWTQGRATTRVAPTFFIRLSLVLVFRHSVPHPGPGNHQGFHAIFCS